MKWTRSELKERAKEALRRNYWKAVFVSFIFIVLSGGGSFSSSSSIAGGGKGERADNPVPVETDMPGDNGDFEWTVTEEDASEQNGLIENMAYAISDSIEEALDRLGEARVAFVVTFAVVAAILFFGAMLIGLAVDAFLINPLWVGAQRFMLKCLDDKGNIAELGYTFDHHYLNGVKTTFMRDLYVFLWALLFLIPGIYKKYQYYMVEFILAENPDMPYREVLERSKKMMDGQKWNAFVLDLSFILWHMLGFITCGISEIAFVRPYINLTRAALYRALSGGMQEGVAYEL
ncbi:MAG: DUF975 family protein [Lachnospiraceae bacterium]|nr:DUF975 family protein [Lachnospiraceae bacterium]